MAISNVSSVNTNINYQNYQQNKTGGIDKAALSIIPGLGQACDGRIGTGAAYLGGVTAGSVGTYFLTTRYALPAAKALMNSAKLGFGGKVALAGAIALAITTAALWGSNITDAYKGEKLKPIDLTTQEYNPEENSIDFQA